MNKVSADQNIQILTVIINVQERLLDLTLSMQQLTWLYETSFYGLAYKLFLFWMTVHVKKKLISVLVTSGLWDWGLPVALEIDEQLVTQFHGKKKLLFFLKKSFIGKDWYFFVCCLLVYFFWQSKQIDLKNMFLLTWSLLFNLFY